MKRLIILLELIIIIALLYIGLPKAEAEPDYFLMTCIAYSNHPNCIADRYRDGLTATGVPIREGIVALNVVI